MTSTSAAVPALIFVHVFSFILVHVRLLWLELCSVQIVGQ